MDKAKKRTAHGLVVEPPARGLGTKAGVDYAKHIPETAAAFRDALQAFYTQHDAALATSMAVYGMSIDPYTLFKAVGAMGGGEAVCTNR